MRINGEYVTVDYGRQKWPLGLVDPEPAHTWRIYDHGGGGGGGGEIF